MAIAGEDVEIGQMVSISPEDGKVYQAVKKSWQAEKKREKVNKI